jgi:hypothetical protein
VGEWALVQLCDHAAMGMQAYLTLTQQRLRRPVRRRVEILLLALTPGGKPLDREWDDPNRQRLVLAEELTGCIKLVWQEAGQGPMTDIVAQSFFDITTNRPHAIVTLDDKRTEYLPLGAEPDLAEFPGFHRVCRIPGTVIRSVAVALYEGPQHYALLARQPDINRNPYRDPASVLSAPLAR